MSDVIFDRSLDALSAPPFMNLDGLSDHTFEGELKAALEDRAAPYFENFDAQKAVRHRAIRSICEDLEEGPIVACTFNWGFRQLFENWIASCDRHGIDCRAFTLVFPMDEQADRFVRERGFKTYFDGLSYGDVPMEACEVFGDETFRKCMFAKIAVTQDMLEIGADVLFQDVDMVWLRDPRPDLWQRADSESLDFLFMFDGPNRLYEPLHYNTGFYCVRNNPFSCHAWDAVFSNFARILHCGSDQPLINRVLSFLLNRGLRCDRLAEDVFINGHVMVQAARDHKPLPASGAVVHASWTANIEKKLTFLKQFDLWYI